MPIITGKRLGPYEILSAVGAGGMGEVYRAKDTRLDRIVAIKTLPDHLADQAELRDRFEREARTIAGLNHPHICVLHDIGHHDGTDYLVMEYIEGETLAQRLTKGPLPLDQVLKYAVEIADALDKAHRKGITHRDLKPGNIMLTKSGAKLLDFGLAKLTQPDSPAVVALSQAPTLKDPVTAKGTILGTLQYMVPEQLEGKEADARTDIFAFGVVVYEMTTGKKAFEGKTQASLIAKILETEPSPLSSLQPMTPPALDRVVKRCLAKEPDERWQNAKDLTAELEWIAQAGSQAGIPKPIVAQRLVIGRIAWVIAGVAVVATLVLALLHFHQATSEMPVVRAFIPPPEKMIFPLTAGAIAVSPDGRRLAFVAGTSSNTQLWIRSLDALTPQPLAGTDGATYPFWSPDSKFVGFFADSKLKKIDASGGPPLTLCDARLGRGGTWNKDGVIVFVPNFGSPLYRVSASGGVPSPLTTLDQTQNNGFRGGAYFPWFLPDGRHFLYVAVDATNIFEGSAIRVGSIDSKEDGKVVVDEPVSNAIYAQGYLLFLRENTLMAQPFDSERLATRGDALPIAEQIQLFSVSGNGFLAYLAGGLGLRQLAWFDRSGRQIATVGEPADLGPFNLSHDGKNLAVSVYDRTSRNRDIWIFDMLRGLRSRFTFGQATANHPVWSPDGHTIVFSSNRKGHYDLYQKPADGSRTEELLYADNLDKVSTGWSQDGNYILYYAVGDLRTKSDLWILPWKGERKPFTFMQTSFNESQGQFSPDGRWIAYTSDESGRSEIYVAPFPGPGGKRQISANGAGGIPNWRPDGKEIFYIAPNRDLMAAEVDTKGATLDIGLVHKLFSPIPAVQGHNYDISPEGQRFVAYSIFGREASEPLTLVQNWTAGLKK